VVEECERRFAGRIFFSIQTNGSLLTEHVIRFLTEHKVSISVSVDGVTHEDNALRTNRSNLDPYAHIKRLTSDNPALPRTMLGLRLTVTPHNVGSLDRIILKMERDGFASVSFSFYQPVKRSQLDQLEWNADTLVAKLTQVIDLVNRREVVGCSLQYLIQLTLRILNLRYELTCLSSPCGAGAGRDCHLSLG
jgi:sulfatase maturation enzyme AslB (radical SAM superfamily)